MLPARRLDSNQFVWKPLNGKAPPAPASVLTLCPQAPGLSTCLASPPHGSAGSPPRYSVAARVSRAHRPEVVWVPDDNHSTVPISVAVLRLLLRVTDRPRLLRKRPSWSTSLKPRDAPSRTETCAFLGDVFSLNETLNIYF